MTNMYVIISGSGKYSEKKSQTGEGESMRKVLLQTVVRKGILADELDNQSWIR